ncbi:5-oxoprolinase subunit PxpB [Marinobacter salinisoli]|uniref:5-oxoprolinase subunit PxpB n=1 Tax=Marinobacter salinisoli TaxID=2769486 RepID=A0ABX7MRS9_9GAMM|nr:5-oxoprolinase subunit PxpB [Marinobacter salinisoli]QSP93806.1 5-oxoprolinase subunit PxpB [Marinobacter salinisoli]
MIQSVSDDSLLITLGDQIAPSLTPRIARLCTAIERACEPWLVDIVPSYTTILVVYDPLRIDFRGAEARIGQLARELNHARSSEHRDTAASRTHDIPVYYSDETGPDLERIAGASGVAKKEVIRRHTEITYQVYALGFMPGFGFLGSVDESIATPRLETPRNRVPAGSVAIANRQTAVYPEASPGGWNLIGRSPTRMFDPVNLSLLSVGDQVKFRSVSRAEYLDLGGQL